MIYLVFHPITGERYEFPDSLEAARAKKQELKDLVTASEAARFTAVRETVEGETVTWTPVILDEETEEGRYQVFNTFTGQHEPFDSLVMAKARRHKLIDTFLNDLGLNDEPMDKSVFERETMESEMKLKNAQSMNNASLLPVTRLGDQ